MGEQNTRDQAEASEHRHRRWPWYAGGVLVAFVAILLLLPYAIRWGAEYWLRKQGQDARIEAVSFNLFTGRLELSAVQAGRGKGEELDARSVVVRVDWWPFWEKRVYVEDLSLAGITLDVRREADGTVMVGGLPIVTHSEPNSPPAPAGGKAWGIALGNVDLRDVRVRYRDPALETEVLLRRLHVDPLVSWAPDVATPFDLKAELESGTIEVSGSAKPFHASPSVAARLTMKELPLGWLAPALRVSGVENFHVTVDASADVEASASQGEGGAAMRYRGSLSLADLGLGTSGLRGQADRLVWEGDVSGQQTATGVDLRLDGDLDVAGGSFVSPDGTASIATAKVAADLTGTLGDSAALDGKLALTVRNAKGFGASVPALNLAWSGPVKADFGRGTISTDGELRIDDSVAAVTEPGLQARVGAFQWRGQAGLAPTDGDAPQPQLSGEADLGKLSVRPTTADRELFGLNHLEVSALTLAGPENITVDRIRLEGIRALERAQGADAGETHALTVANLELSALEVSGGPRVQVETVSLLGLVAELSRNTSGAWEGLELLPGEAGSAPLQEGDTARIDTARDESKSISVRIGRLGFGDDTRIALRDRGVNPAVQLDLDVPKLQVLGVDTSDPGAVTEVDLEARLGKYSRIAVDARGTLLAPLASGKAKADVENVSLPPLTGYTERYLGYRLKTGQLDLDTEAIVKAGQLDAQNQVVLRRLQLELLHPDEQDALTQELGLPLNTALSLLRDRDGNIRLSVPIQGALDDPEIGIGDAVRKAVVKGVAAGVKTAAMVFFAPVGAVMAAGKLVSLATALRFEPVGFPAGKAMLGEDARKYLAKLSALLKDRPGVSITLCGVATSGDRAALQTAAQAATPQAPLPPPAATETPATPSTVAAPTPEAPPRQAAERQPTTAEAGGVEVPPPLPEISQEELLDLAQRRGDAVRDFLVEVDGIDPKRLLPCSPQVEEGEEAHPRVEISL